jgi:hexosaminidase
MQLHHIINGNFISHSIYGLIIVFLISSCTQRKIIPKDLLKEALIPIPVSVEATGQSYELTDHTVVYTSGDYEFIDHLIREVKALSGLTIDVAPMSSMRDDGNIYISLKELDNPNEEAYELEITPDYILLHANTERGLFYGIQSLRQMMPKEVESVTHISAPILIASGKIIDYPRFGYRGAMLDISRHFFGVSDIKKYIDYLSKYKMNTLHLHMSDDQGWRIEIKSRPKLTEVGSLTAVGGGKGGYLSQNDYKEIVRYAQSKYVTIIPEIDMPGHTNAALVAYPELNCNKKDPYPKPYTGMKVGFSTLCTRNPAVYDFLDDVIRELASMTPGAYIHIGGDESHVTKKSDYITFVNKVQKIVSKYGKKTMGWDDISASTLSDDAIVQHWSDKTNAIAAVEQNAKVLMSPATRTYLDMQYDSTTPFGLHWAAYIELDSAYMWDPGTYIDGVQEADIVGLESPLWSETIDNLDKVEYLAFPRIIGHAEIGWSPQNKRNWQDYKSRLAIHESRLIEMGIDFYRSPLIARDSLSAR